MTADNRVSILGAGTWGIALARMLAVNGREVTVWSALPSEIENLKVSYIHPRFPEVRLPDSIRFTDCLEEACSEKDLIVFAVPSIYIRSTAKSAGPYINDGQLIADVAKGIEDDTLFTMTQVIADELKNDTVSLVALSGPTHAEEVIIDLPTAIVSACADPGAAGRVQEFFSTPSMRVYTNQDILGIELCGALKNIIALATGISGGLGYGDNARAALITRGLYEISLLGIKLGCSPKTFSGLAGMGDLIVTCTSTHSRNNRCGYLIGRGVSPSEAVKQVGMVVEGINALPAAVSLAEKYNVEMPIISGVNDVVNKGVAPLSAVNRLLNRSWKNEVSGLAL